VGYPLVHVDELEIPPNVVGREHNEEETQQEEVNVSSPAPACTASRARTSQFDVGASCGSIRRRHASRSPGPRA
jgi:hypothetical protein